jgi:hypothetical protein
MRRMSQELVLAGKPKTSSIRFGVISSPLSFKIPIVQPKHGRGPQSRKITAKSIKSALLIQIGTEDRAEAIG